jgi:cell division protein FtsB
MPAVQPDNSHNGGFVSLLFWFCLAVAAGLYAACALAPRGVVWAELRAQSDCNQAELANLERQLQQLTRIAHALERDPAFAAELARVDLGAARAGEARIPLPPSLGFDPRAPRMVEVVAGPFEPWYLPAARLLATDTKLRWKMLAIAAGLLLFAFVFLSGDISRLASLGATSRRILRTVFGRYLLDGSGERRP